MKIITGVGARNTPENILKRMRKISKFCSQNNIFKRTGDAVGADACFREYGNYKQFTPNDDLPCWTKVFVEYFHPNPRALSDYAYRLMQRNSLQVLGDLGDHPSDMLICYTDNGKQVGGTAQSMKIAEFYDVPIYNLYFEDHYKQVVSILKSWKVEENL